MAIFNVDGVIDCMITFLRYSFITGLFTLLVAGMPDNSLARPAGRKQHYFRRRERVLFDDDFSQDAIGTFPAKWRFAACNKPLTTVVAAPGLYLVHEIDDKHELAMNSTSRYLEPKELTGQYLLDSFTVEFDFMFDTSGCAELFLYTRGNRDGCPYQSFHLLSTGHMGEAGFPNDTGTRFFGRFRYPFLPHVPHHFALSYCKGAYDIFGDHEYVATVNHAELSPYAVALSCIAPMRYQHFRITTGREEDAPADLLAGKKVVTHAILFDIGKWTIKPESDSYIKQLAQLLKDNPRIKLEIDGHTDSDGDAAANLRLSRQRADEVKNQLVLRGIPATRLITKGYGATRPLQPNTTPAAKENNRRVEFVKK